MVSQCPFLEIVDDKVTLVPTDVKIYKLLDIIPHLRIESAFLRCLNYNDFKLFYWLDAVVVIEPKPRLTLMLLTSILHDDSKMANIKDLSLYFSTNDAKRDIEHLNQIKPMFELWTNARNDTFVALRNGKKASHPISGVPLLDNPLHDLTSIRNATEHLCRICMDATRNTNMFVMTECSHIICGPCLNTLSIVEDKHQCPWCRHLFDPINVLPLRII